MHAGRLSVLVLGETGMLGRACGRLLRRLAPGWRVEGTSRGGERGWQFNIEQGIDALERVLDNGPYNYVINCIGVLSTDIDGSNASSVARAVRINALFPHELAAATSARGARVLHVSTDAVFSGRAGTPLIEQTQPDPVDVYGRAKALGESACAHVLNIRCSIVGRGGNGRGLTDWYLATGSETVVTGFVDYVWTPATVYQLAEYFHWILADDQFVALRAAGPALHFAPNPPLSKHEYLIQLRALSGRGAMVEAGASPGGRCDRTLASSRPGIDDGRVSRWQDSLLELISEDTGVHRR